MELKNQNSFRWIMGVFTAVIFFSACNKKKEFIGVKPPPKSAQESSENPNLNSNSSTEGREDSPGGEEPQYYGDEYESGPREPREGGSLETSPPGSPSAPTTSSTSRSLETEYPEFPEYYGDEYKNYPSVKRVKDWTRDEVRPIDQEEVSKDAPVSKRITGAIASQGLDYGALSSDDVHGHLRAFLEKQNLGMKKMNLRLASEVITLKWTRREDQFEILIEMKESGSMPAHYAFQGVSQDGNRDVRMNSVLKNSLGSTNGNRKYVLTGTCLDLDSQCENLLLKMDWIQGEKVSGKVFVVLRDSEASLYYKLPGNASQNPEYLSWRSFLINTTQRTAGTQHFIQNVRLGSWEVTNGRSGFEAALVGANNELIAFAGPLLSMDRAAGAKMPLEMKESSPAGFGDELGGGRRFQLTNYVSHPRLLFNNSLGKITLEFQIRKSLAHSAQETIQCSFLRKGKPLVSIQQFLLK